MPKKFTTEEFIIKAKNVHEDKYNYDKVEYINSSHKIEIFCNTHKEYFWQLPSNHLQGQGCLKCSIENNSIAKRFTIEEFINKAKQIHGDKYNYDKVEYINNHIKVDIFCNVHKEYFSQTPGSHLSGCGCFRCGAKIRLTNDVFINKAKEIHGNKYNYDKVEYVNTNTKIKIFCNIHQEFFEQTPNSHLRGSGCPNCINRISKLEVEWLNFLRIPNDKDHRQVMLLISGQRFYVDGFDSETKTVFEFNGDYYHGNPNIFNSEILNTTTNCTFGKLYSKTLAKEKILKEAGYKVISIWASDFKKMENNINS